ncbi:hypothetical protein V8D89_001599 [Ganoderma adspersum]
MASSPNATSTELAPVSIPATIPSLDNTYGAILLGTFGGLMLYGLTIHQAFRYSHLPSYKTDATYIKVTVAIVLVLETFYSALSMLSCYHYSITNYANPEALFHGTWSLNLLPVSTGIAVAVSQSYFAYRLFKFNPRYAPIIALAVILLIGESALSIALTIEAFVQPDLSDYQNSSWMLSGAMRGMIVAADGILTVMLTILLHRSRTGFKSTDSMLNVLILYTINTGLLTGTTSLISFILGVAFPHTLIGDGMSLCMAKLYTNSMLAVLNSRDFLSNYGTGKSGYGATPSKISPIHPSALATPTSNFDWPSERGFPAPSPGLLPDMQYVLDIKAAGPGQVPSQRGVPCGEDTVFTDRTSEMSIELCDLHDSSSKSPAASQPSRISSRALF